MEISMRSIGKFLRELIWEPRINRKYKDILFRYVLADKKVLLKLYNALNETDYSDSSELEINTLENVIYLSYKNDLSFIIGNTVNLYEHQSTVNPNMPLRGLRYIAQLYNVYIEKIDENIYGSKLITIPRPQCIVFYNGKEYQEEQKVLKLSDAFEADKVGRYDSNLEFTVTVLNINYGNNKELLAKCCELEQYARFIHILRRYTDQGLSMKVAIRKTINECIEQDILKDILVRNESEVMEMFMTKYNKKAHMRVVCNEAREEGREEGRLEADAKWEKVVAEKEVELAKKDEIIAELLAKNGNSGGEANEGTG